MSKEWDYAVMVQDAASAGGPDKWLEIIKSAAYDAGASDMKNVLVVPLIAGGIGLGIVGTIAWQKIQKWVTDKKQVKQIAEQEATMAEKFLKKELTDAIEEIETKNGGCEE